MAIMTNIQKSKYTNIYFCEIYHPGPGRLIKFHLYFHHPVGYYGQKLINKALIWAGCGNLAETNSNWDKLTDTTT